MRKYILAILVIALILGNTNNTRELKNLAIVKAIGIDKEKSGEYSISVIVADTEDKESNGKGIIYKSKGESIQEALRNCVDISPKRLYLAHLESLIVSQDIATNDLQNVLDFFIRDNEGSNSFHFLIARDTKAEDIISSINNEEVDILNLIKSSQKYRGNCNLNTLNDLVKKLLEKGNEICVNTIELRDDNTAIGDMAYFEGWKFKGYMNSNESIMYNMLNNLTHDVIISIGEDEDLTVCEITSSKVNFKIEKEDKNTIIINTKITGEITQTGKHVKLSSSEEINKKEIEFEDEINKEINELIQNIVIQNNVDILGFGNLYYRKKISSGDINLQNLNIILNTEVKIVSQGGVKNNW